MQSIIKFCLGSLVFALAATSCVKQKIETPSLAEFASSSTSNVGAYYIPDDPSTTFKVPVGITTPSGKDRVINFSVSSPTGATEGTQYTIGTSSITIPAGKVVDSITVKGIFAGYASGRKDTLKFTITGGDASIQASASTYTLVLQKYCPVVLNDLLGKYTKCYDTYLANGGQYGYYTINIVSATATSATTAKLVLQGFAEASWTNGGWGPTDPASDPGITVNIDWTNPGNFIAIVPNQTFFVDPGFDDAVLKSGAGSFSSCTDKFVLKWTANQQGTDYGFQTNMSR